MLININARQIRKLFGLDQLGEIIALLLRLENHMANAREQIQTLSGKLDDVMADVRAFRDAAEADRASLSTDAQQAFDDLSAKVDAFDQEVGDGDGSDTAATPPVGAPEDAGTGTADTGTATTDETAGTDERTF